MSNVKYLNNLQMIGYDQNERQFLLQNIQNYDKIQKRMIINGR